MNTIHRRTFLRLASAGLACATGAKASAQPLETTAESLEALGLKCVGQVAPRTSASIKASPLSVGFEVLDRKGFAPEPTYEHLAQLGVKWARCQTGWCRCETKQGVYDFAWLDEIVDSLLKIGIQPWFNLGYGNKLYLPDAPDEFAVGWVPVYDEDAMKAWLSFTKALAEHFSTRVKHWEIWNEPNIAWQPEKPNPADYVRFVAETAPVIRKAVPEAKIIGISCGHIKMDYIQGCLDEGITDYLDIISYHPYRAYPEDGYEDDIAKMRAAIGAHNKNIVLWQGENGAPSQGGPKSVGALSSLPWTEAAQAKWLLRRILTDLRLQIPLTCYFHTVDLVGYLGKTNFKGLLRGTDYTCKPSYYAYQCLCALFDAETHPVSLSPTLIDQEKGKLQEAEFARGGHALYAYWYPGNMIRPWEAQTLSVRLTFPEGATITDPVLIDPLSGKAYKPGKVEVDKAGLVAHDLPLMNHPLILTDKALVKSSE